MIFFRATKSRTIRSSGRAAVALLGLAAGGTLAGCANPGVPRPPSLHLPAAVTDLSGERIGDRVELRWTAPKRTTDGLELTPTTFMTAEVCRDPAVSATSAAKPAIGKPGLAVCTTVMRVPNLQGGSVAPFTAEDRLPASLVDDRSQGVLLAYRVRMLNDKGRSADPSAPVLIPAGPAVAGLDNFNATQSSLGVVLEWRADPAARGTVEVMRTLVTPPGSAPAVAQKVTPAEIVPKKGRKSVAPGGKKAGKSRSDDDAGVVRLRQDVSDTGTFRKPGGRDGMIDQGAVLEQKYIYSAQRVETRQIAGHSLVMWSEPTVSTTIERRDTFAPAPPRGLASIPGVLRDPADANVMRATIDLSWEPNVETDVAGYNIYRIDLADGAAATPKRLNPALLAGPAYRDSTVAAGHRYRYTVTAVDRTGNESDAGAAVEDESQAR